MLDLFDFTDAVSAGLTFGLRSRCDILKVPLPSLLMCFINLSGLRNPINWRSVSCVTVTEALGELCVCVSGCWRGVGGTVVGVLGSQFGICCCMNMSA